MASAAKERELQPDLDLVDERERDQYPDRLCNIYTQLEERGSLTTVDP